MSVFRLVIPMTAMVVLAVSTPAAQTRPPAIPTCAGLTLVPDASSAQSETCYRDDIGRIVKRRRPGYVEGSRT